MGEKSEKNWSNALPFQIIIPVILTVCLFVMTIFFLIQPILKDQMMTRKREMIRELTKAAWSTLDTYWERETAGIISREQAQKLAMEHLRHLRYGPEMKDYFWINDMHPRIVMHPYRPEMEGNDISHYADPNGKLLFLEFVKIVESQGEGYVDYEWQWKDDPEKIVPKISYVKGFLPWGWIVGTGIYIEDVRAEIASITRKLTLMCFGILIIIIGLSSYIVFQGLKSERGRLKAEKQSKIQQEQIFQAAKMTSLGTLVSGVAHEINNPITSVMLNTPVIKKVWQSIEPVLQKHCQENGDFKVGNMNYSQLHTRMPILIEDIAEGAKRVKAIVNDLKNYARQSPPEMNDSVDINTAVKKSAGLVANLIKKSTNHFSMECENGLPTFKGNSQRIEQVIINLLVNACQALTSNSQPILISTFYDEPNQSICIRITDYGKGMPKETLDRITDPFYTTKREEGGTGLGLSICDKIIKDHGGSMIFESELGKGTTANVSIPL
ncbi:MAG: cache domain-containing protein [Desulfobacterales bacterium]